MINCQSASARFISSVKAATSPMGTCGSDAPWQTSIFAVIAPASAGKERRVIAQGSQAGHYSLTVARDAVAVHVAGQDGVAEFRVAECLISCVLVEAGAALHE